LYKLSVFVFFTVHHFAQTKTGSTNILVRSVKLKQICVSKKLDQLTEVGPTLSPLLLTIKSSLGY